MVAVLHAGSHSAQLCKDRLITDANWDTGALDKDRLQMPLDAYSTDHVAVPSISGSDGQRAHACQLRWGQRTIEH